MLDTHVLIWWLRDNPKLGSKARALIADPSNEVIVSIASFWEISIKFRIGKLDLSGTDVFRDIVGEDMDVIQIELEHLEAIEALPRHHGDPFDHLILAQAKCEQARLITSDQHMTEYGVRCIGAS